MSSGYQSLKPPEATVEYEDSDDNSIQGSPLLNTGPVFPRNSVVEAPDSIDLGDQMTYYQDESYEDELYGSPYQPRQDSPHHTIEEADPYVASSPTANGYSYAKDSSGSFSKRGGYVDVANASPGRTPLTPIIEPVSEVGSTPPLDKKKTATPSSVPNGEAGARAGLSSPLRVSEPEFSSPHSHLKFTRSRNRPKSAFISPSFRAPSGTNIISEPTKQPVLQQNPPGTNTHDNKAQLPGNTATGADEDEDTLPFEATTRMAMQGRPQSMIQLTSPDRGMVMTKESFESYRRSVLESDLLNRESSFASGRISPTRYNSISRGSSPTRGIGNSGRAVKYDEDDKDVDFDVSNEKEQKRKSARLRQEQDARMSIYRQSMMKIIGSSPGAPGDGVSISSARTIPDNKSISLDRDDAADSDLMDDIPLSILQAHRFPKKTPQSKSPSAMPAARASPEYHDTADNVDTARSASWDKTRGETGGSAGASPRPLSIASSRMLPNVFNSEPNRHSRGFGYNSGRPTSTQSLPQIFGNKDAMLSRGLIGEISREEDARRKRQTIGYGVEKHTNITPSPTVPTVGSLKDPGQLQDKLDVVIEMLAKLSPQDPSSSPQLASQYGTLDSMRPVTQRASSIYSFQSGDMHGNMGMPGSPSPYSPHFGYPMGNQQPAAFPSPLVPPHPHQMPAPQNMPFFPQPARPAPPVVSNRPSRMRLVKPMDGEEDEDDDEVQMKKLKEQRESLKKQWMQESDGPHTVPSSAADHSAAGAAPSELVDREQHDTEAQHTYDSDELA